MNSILDFIKREPAVLVALVDAVLVLGVTLGLPVSTETKAGIDGILIILAGIITRANVTPVNAPPKPVAPKPVVPPAA